MEHLKKWWTVYGAGVIAAVTTFAPAVQSQHPKWAGYIAAALTALAGMSKSPVQGGN